MAREKPQKLFKTDAKLNSVSRAFVESLMKVKSPAERRRDRGYRGQGWKDRPHLVVMEPMGEPMSESRKDELLARYGLGSAARREALSRSILGR